MTIKTSKWKNAPTLEILKGDFNNSKEEHDSRTARVSAQLDALHMKGKHDVVKKQGKSKVKPKIVKRNAEWRYTEISEPFLDDDKLFSAAPVSWEDRDNAIQNETLLNWQFRHQLNTQDLIDTSTRKFVDEGTVYARVGWLQETRTVEQDTTIWQYVQSVDVQEMVVQEQIISRALDIRQENPYAYNQIRDDILAAVEFYEEHGEVVIALPYTTIKEKVEELVKESPTVDIINQRNLYLDPTANGDVNKAKFAVYLFPESKAGLKATGLYSNLDKVNWSENGLQKDSNFDNSDSTNFSFKDEARKQVVVYEYWGYYDIDNDGLLEPIVAAWVGDTLIRLEENPYPDKKLPFCSAKYRPVVDQYDGESDAPLIEDNQHTIGAITRGIIDLLARAANGQRGVANGLLDETNYKRFTNGDDYWYNPNGDPKSQIIESKFSEVPISAMNVIQWQQMDSESLTGVKSFGSTGISGDSLGQTATGVRSVTSSASQRKMGILRRYKQFIIDIGSKIMAMNQVYLSEDKVVRITNEEFVTVAKDRLKGNYDLSLEISTREVDQEKANRLSFLMQTLGNTLDFSITQKLMVQYARLERMPDLAHDISLIQPPQPSQADQLELAKLQAQVRELESKVLLNQSKANAEGSKSRLTDLNYLEQGSGVKHKRDIEAQGAQARANQNLEITKGLLSRNANQNPDSDRNINDAVGYNILSQQLEELMR